MFNVYMCTISNSKIQILKSKSEIFAIGCSILISIYQNQLINAPSLPHLFNRYIQMLCHNKNSHIYAN